MSWTFEKAKFKVGDRVRFPYGRKVGVVKAVGSQVYEGKWLGHLYQVTSYELTEAQLRRFRAPRPQKSDEAGHFGNCDAIEGRRRRGK